MGYNPLLKKTPITVKIGGYFETKLLLVNDISFTFSQEVGLTGKPLYAKVKIDLSFCRPVSYREVYSMFSIKLNSESEASEAIKEMDSALNNKNFFSSLKVQLSAISDKIASSYKVNGKTYI